jgi:hypothetical protein
MRPFLPPEAKAAEQALLKSLLPVVNALLDVETVSTTIEHRKSIAPDITIVVQRPEAHLSQFDMLEQMSLTISSRMIQDETWEICKRQIEGLPSEAEKIVAFTLATLRIPPIKPSYLVMILSLASKRLEFLDQDIRFLGVSFASRVYAVQHEDAMRELLS